MSTTPTPPNTSTADVILNLFDNLLMSAGILVPFGQLADLLLEIIQKGVSAYESHTGQAIDVTLLKPIDKV